MPLLADGRDIRRKNQTIGATFHNRFIGRRWEGYDGFSTGEVHPSAGDAPAQVSDALMLTFFFFCAMWNQQLEGSEIGREATHCTAGALCKPPSNLAGMLMKLKAFGSARLATRAPWVPGVAETTRLATDQHSRTDSLWALPVIAVMLSG